MMETRWCLNTDKNHPAHNWLYLGKVVNCDGYTSDRSGLGEDFTRIYEVLIPEFQKAFAKKAREYGQMHRELGIKAQYVDLNRKLGKLRRAWWDDVPTDMWREQPREIAMDMIGHLLLAIALLDREAKLKVSDVDGVPSST